MLPSHITFARTLDTISGQLEFLRQEHRLLKLGSRLSEPTGEAEREVQLLARLATRSAPKRFSHTWAVVELYAAIEQLIEGLIRDYLLRLQHLAPRFGDLPGSIVRSHVRKTFELLDTAGKLGRRVSEAQLVSNLHSCLFDQQYQLNHDAFVLHLANLRSEVVNQLFAGVGVERVLARVKQTERFQQYLRASGTSHVRTPQQTEGTCAELDDLVLLRNEAAHGSASNFLSIDLLEQLVTFGRALGDALLEVIEESAVAIAVELRGELAGETVAVYNSRVVCIRLHQSLNTGDAVAAKTAKGRFRAGRVLRLEVSGHPVECAAPPAEVGVEVGFRAKQNQAFYAFPGLDAAALGISQD